MARECRQFKIAIKEFKAMAPAYLECYCRNLVPDVLLRFVTFANNDFRKEMVTTLIYNYIPDSVFFFVTNPLGIESALDALTVLNPGVEWYLGTLNYFKEEDSAHASMKVELSFSTIPMRVDANGKLIYK